LERVNPEEGDKWLLYWHNGNLLNWSKTTDISKKSTNKVHPKACAKASRIACGTQQSTIRDSKSISSPMIQRPISRIKSSPTPPLCPFILVA
jgi:hypothetical protein